MPLILINLPENLEDGKESWERTCGMTGDSTSAIDEEIEVHSREELKVM